MDCFSQNSLVARGLCGGVPGTLSQGTLGQFNVLEQDGQYPLPNDDVG